MGMTRWQRLRAWLNFLPCLSLSINAVGIPTGIWRCGPISKAPHVVPEWTLWLAAGNLSALALSL